MTDDDDRTTERPAALEQAAGEVTAVEPMPTTDFADVTRVDRTAEEMMGPTSSIFDNDFPPTSRDGETVVASITNVTDNVTEWRTSIAKVLRDRDGEVETVVAPRTASSDDAPTEMRASVAEIATTSGAAKHDASMEPTLAAGGHVLAAAPKTSGSLSEDHDGETIVAPMTAPYRDDDITEFRPSAAKVATGASLRPPVSPSMMETGRLPPAAVAAGRALAAEPPDRETVVAPMRSYRDDDVTELRASAKVDSSRAHPSNDSLVETGRLPQAQIGEGRALAAAPPPAVRGSPPNEDFDDQVLTELIDPIIARARERIGKVLREKWRIDGLLGVGGMAAVYLATHRNGARVAVKMLHAELSNNAQVQGRFRREGRVANAVGHEGVVKIIDDDTAEDGSAFLVMELLDGETLEERRVRNGGRLSEDEVLRAADQLLDVLVAAHARGVVHRDLKPENVFLTRTGVVRVLDFGIARLRGVSTASTATQLGSSMGTPQFMPPEQARALWDQVDARSDLWAVGATMFTLLTGQFIHNGRTTNEVLLSAMSKAAPPVASLARNVSPAVARVVDRALAFEREHRWLDATRMREAVHRAYVDRFGKPITTSPKLTAPDGVLADDVTGAMPAAQQVWPKPGSLHARWLAHLRCLRYQVSKSVADRRLPLSRAVIASFGLSSIVMLAAGIALIATLDRGKAHTSRSASPAESPRPTQSATPTPTPLPPVAVSAANTPTPAAMPGTPQPQPGSLSTAFIPTMEPSRLPAAPPAPVLPDDPYRRSSGALKSGECDPPYVIDADGHKIYKRSCLVTPPIASTAGSTDVDLARAALLETPPDPLRARSLLSSRLKKGGTIDELKVLRVACIATGDDACTAECSRRLGGL